MGASYFVALCALLLWSGTPIANKVAVATIDPATAGLLRSMLAGVAALFLASFMRLPFPKESRLRWLLLASGILNFVLWPLLFSTGIGWTSASHAALIVALTPIVTGLIAGSFERRWPHGSWWAGTAIAFAGGVFLILVRNGGPLVADRAGVLGDLTILLGIGFSGLGWVSVAYMTFCSSLLGYCAWFWALGHGGIVRISALQLSQPVVTIIVAALWLGETLTWPLVVAAAIILVGTWLAQRPQTPETL